MPRFKMVNGVSVQLTQEEEAARDAEEAAWDPAANAVAQNLAERAGAIAMISSLVKECKLIRGVALAALDEVNALRNEVNVLRQRDVDRAADVQNSGSFGALKTAWAARSALTAIASRTIQQLRTVIQNKVEDGSADS